ncbi:class I mannose-6-phosphate isomerase [Paraglaciecola aquimarina]|uniref:Class I mannose-6-phosphate isomerase n=1 Tax=Paraglaciecola aquimarina TaxID=1235557 RepID=A0ABU3SUW1_9ALTE|nr:class I mannose-6-phosphate isomerase [Paraglaciecola aquimarina]MDU0353800.1 class I mannose-6-phosphate isomerase [Paraglaciecola aquimarina]
MNQIIKFTANRVWRTYQGGKLLDTIEGKENPKDSSFPEDWIGSTVEARNVGREHVSEGLAMVENASGEIVAFRDLLKKDQRFFLGKNGNAVRSMDDIPLVKYLDSSTRLHFQAHPTREFAQQRLGLPRGKTEAYVILETREDVKDPYIYAGFQRSPSREQLKKWIETQDIQSIEGCFDRISVKPCDVFLLPGGRPHALGEGILMLEIMEPSDLAVRFEFERCGYVIPEQARFMDRGIETALDAFNFEPVPPEKTDQEFRCLPTIMLDDGQGNRLEQLIGADKTPCFTVRRASVNGQFTRQEDAFFYGIVTQGSGAIVIDGETIQLKQWERFFCPAGVAEFAYMSETGMSILECYPGNV